MDRKESRIGCEALLLKIRPTDRLGAARSKIDLEPLYGASTTESERFSLDSKPRWFLARNTEGPDQPWDMAHAEIARQLGIDESDVLYAEPDLVHSVFVEVDGQRGISRPMAIGGHCVATPQDRTRGKAAKPDEFAWHLDRYFSQLGLARADIEFSEPRTRIAHIDTGYYPTHETTPAHVLKHLEWNFVGKDGRPTSASDPDNWIPILDNSGHGTGTLSILAGGPVSAHGGAVLGGAPEAAIIPLRVADSVVLLRTSSLARALRYATDVNCDVATLSMGGLPTRAWAEAVDDAYLAGLCICAAAGNHISFMPPTKLVYPARYDRVIAVCGVMANGKPYARLKKTAMEGCFGPESAMKHAVAAYTPNIPWAKYGCSKTVRLNGEGTSSATPQVAAAVALWLEKYKHELPRDWRRVEAVRHAIFSSAKTKADSRHFGNGILQARKALKVKPLLTLPKSERSNNSFAFLRVLTGLGIDRSTPREEMYNVELAQRWLLNSNLQEIIPDPDATQDLTEVQLQKFMEAVIEDDGASTTLRRHLASRYPVAAGRPVPDKVDLKKINPKLPPVGIDDPEIPDPPHRRIRVFATDPSLSQQLDTAENNEVTLHVRWEKLTNGPVGEYLRVEDKGPHNYPGVNLNNRNLLAQDGWAPSEGNPQFHQQMVYAVAMKTIEHFERALGRPILWRARPSSDDPYDDSQYAGQLKIRPHAFERANAYYSPEEVALLFGYFSARDDSSFHLPGSPVYTCLSHDIIAHETTHAVLDGMYRRFNEPTNPDVLALHEAFADIVALLQHFTIPELLRQEIAKTRGDLEAESLLGKLAVQFGRASSSRGSLRSAIGALEDGEWHRSQPDPTDLNRRVTPHARGAVLVAAVFDALLAIYKNRIADLLRISTGGTGILPSGAIHPDLVGRLANEASKSAGHVLNMCIRALDYLPPVDVTFFDYLRAVITADFEMVNDDRLNYRVAFVEAFSRRGIFPGDHDEQSQGGARSLSADTLRWPGFSRSDLPKDDRDKVLERYRSITDRLKKHANTCLYLDDRQQLFNETRKQRIILQNQLKIAFEETPQFALSLDLVPGRSFEVHTLRRAMRVRLDGKASPQVFLSLTQSETIPEDSDKGVPGHTIRGGSTLVVDLTDANVPRYLIAKNIQSPQRRRATAKFIKKVNADGLLRLFFSTERSEPFAALHELADEGT